KAPFPNSNPICPELITITIRQYFSFKGKCSLHKNSNDFD
ncbi:5545_t:CDS:1, partial [Racocetra fulgida]